MLPPAIGPVGQTLEGHDLILVVGSSVFPYYPYIPGPLLPEGAKLVAITSDPDEAARAPMGDAIVADVKLTLEALLEDVPESDRPAPEPNRGPAGNPAEPTRSTPRPCTRRSAEVFPEDGIVVLESPSSTLALRNQLRLSRPGSYYFGAGGGLGFGLAASVGVQLAQPDRPVVCVIGEGSVQYAVTAFWSAVAYKVPVTFLVLRNEEYAILKWFAEVEQVTGAPGLDLPDARRRRGRRGLRRQRDPGQGPRRGARRAGEGARLLAARAGRSPGRAGHGPLLGADDGAAGAEARAPPPSEPAPDRAPDELAGGTPQPLRGELEPLLGADRVLARASDIVRYASDASPYRLLPQAVVMAHDAERRRQGPRLRPRAAASRSPSAPAAPASTARARATASWSTCAATSAASRSRTDGALARVKPGTVLGHANRVLAPHGRKLGPDPASTDIATRRRRDRQQLGRDALRRHPGLLLDGALADLRPALRHDDRHRRARRRRALRRRGARAGRGPGRDPRRDPRRRRAERAHPPQVRDQEHDRLPALRLPRRRRAAGDLPPPPGRLRGHARLRRRGGLRDRAAAGPHDHRLDPLPRHRRGDRAGPRPGRQRRHRGRADGRPGPDHRRLEHGRRARGVEGAAARVGGAAGRVRRRDRRRSSTPTSPRRSEILAAHETIRPIDFTREAEEIELAWRVREGLHGLIGRLRLPGTALIVEDVCVPPERIAEGARDLQALLGEHGFLPGVAGHASAGNLHFMLTPDFAKQEDLERYEAFMAKLVELIVGKYDGSLKAEHGTGINMAPYVEREWGEKATELMWRVKQLADPDGVLAPGVVLNRDPGVHLRNLKTTPAIEESATTCVECGFCEPVCPSRNLTTTPRQRIVLRREMARQPEGSPLQRALLEEYEYDALETCAADGSCQLACPVGIDTGKLVKELRERAPRRAAPKRRRWRRRSAGARSRGPRARACGSAARWRGGPSAARACPGPAVGKACRATDAARAPPPSTSPPAPTGSSAALHEPQLGAAWSRRWSRSRRGPGCRSGSPTTSPAAAAGCPGARRASARPTATRRTRWSSGSGRWSGEGALPVVIDAASCTQGVADPGEGVLDEENAERLAKLEILDSVAWAHDRLLPQLEVAAQGRLGHRPPDLRDPPHGPRAAPARRSPAPSPTTSTSPPRRPAAASPATAASPTPS